MNNNATHISLVLDRSGSMQQTAEDTIGGFNRFLEEQKKVPGDCTLTLVQFDSSGVDTIHHAVPIASVPPLTRETYQPRDSTPLFDAVGGTILKTGDALHKMREAERPGKVIFAIITDGLENASTKFDHRKVREMIQHQRDVYQWQFIFMGANIDSYAIGQALGVLRTANINHAANAVGISSLYASMGSNVTKFRTGEKKLVDFEDEDRAAQLRAGADQTGGNS